MKHMIRFVGALVVAGAVASLAAATVSAGPTRLNWGHTVNAGSCDTHGAPVVNVTEKIVNDADSGETGNYWALDTINRTIQLWAQPDGTYCAVVRYTGRFAAQAGQTSPGGTGTLTGNESGTLEGGYVATIDGVLLANPLWKTRGNVGTVDYACDLDGNCPGAVNWVDRYFSGGYGFSYTWWGWIYHGGRYGTWVNAVDGNSGDIR